MAARLLLAVNPAEHGWRARLGRWLEARAAWWLLAAGLAGAWLMLALVFDPRYRSFPSAALLLPALAYLLHPCRGPRTELGLLAVLLGIGLPPLLWQETLLNLQALGWAVVALSLLLALWRSRAPSVADTCRAGSSRLNRPAPATARAFPACRACRRVPKLGGRRPRALFITTSAAPQAGAKDCP